MKKKFLTSKKMRATCVGLAALTAMSVASISAFMTDHQEATNTFTVGEVSQTLTEPKWDEADETGIHDNITPGAEFVKDPIVTNDGENDQYVFARVTVPYANVKVAAAGGVVSEAANTQLFSYTVNSGWTQVGSAVDDTTNKTYTYTYVYGSATTPTVLAKDAVTPEIFSSVKFANVVEGQIDGETENIEVKSYGIQTTNLGKTAPADILGLIDAQLA